MFSLPLPLQRVRVAPQARVTVGPWPGARLPRISEPVHGMPGMLRRVFVGLALACLALLAMLFTALNQQHFELDIAFRKFQVSSGLALLITFAAGLLAGAFASSRWIAALLAERGRLRQALRLAETRLGAVPPSDAVTPADPVKPDAH
jgi:uncharacterized integral membrane protein